MTEAIVTVENSTGRRTVRLSSYLDPAVQEQATTGALSWIKHLRNLQVDGESFRTRFTHRGDSLWWFAEIYLHKQRIVESIFHTSAALDALIAREQPSSLQLTSGDRVARTLAPQAAAAHRIGYSGAPVPAAQRRLRLLALDARAAWLHTTALASRRRPRTASAVSRPAGIAAFVHRAFVRPNAEDGGAEAYIGPVLHELERKLGKNTLACVTLGPAENFSARRWWRTVRGSAVGSGLTIESLAPADRLRPSREVWRNRFRHRSSLWNSADLRAASVIGAYDCWPLIREELAGIALLQWPWSARAMDEAGAALDALAPSVALTYAEAGGWGRALMLECRRRGIAGVGLQHGFIYRHWLNYLHEPDEMQPEPGGFPRPALTLLFDGYTESHLTRAGRYPAGSLLVTGSPRLDALVAAAGALSSESIDRARATAGAASKTLVLVATKFREARCVLPGLLDAAGQMPGVHLAIKTHPAETPEVYAALTDGRNQVSVLPASAPLAPLLLASRALVTVNSTVALDAAVLGVPSLVLGLPSNLSPLVEAGVMAGAPEAGIGPALQRILYDEAFRRQIDEIRRTFLQRHQIGSDGRAAARSADAVLRLAERRPGAGE